ncbi:hypothetical protein [Nonomuraea rubra]|uniref:hypothetical protein n=1 Tax=Nonomuraea rubra TaxID=46180 RepID=UPI0034005321
MRRWRQARKLRAGDYIHYPCSGCRVRRVSRHRGGAGIGVECELDSGTVMFTREPRGRDLDVTRTLAGWRRLLPVF